jgi:peroxiredoxin
MADIDPVPRGVHAGRAAPSRRQCGDERALLNELLPGFAKHDAQLMGISVDGAWCRAAYARDRKLHFPLPADFEPKSAVSRTFGAYHCRDGHSERAVFVIDGDGIIRWSYVSLEGVNPGEAAVLRAPYALDAKETTHA